LALISIFSSVLGWKYYRHEMLQDQVRTFQAHALEGFKLRAMNRPEEAAIEYEKAYKLHHADTKTLMDMASVYVQMAQYEKAFRFYLEAYQADPDAYEALYNAALCDVALKRFDAAAERAQKLLHIDRKRSKYYSLIARSLWQNGQKDEALSWYALVQRNTNTIDAEMAAQYEEKKQNITPKSVVFTYENTEDTQALFSLATRYESEGFDVKALRSYEKILIAEPENEKAHLGAAALLQKHGSNAEAMEHYGLISHPDAAILEKIGSLHHGLKAYEKALEFYERSYALHPHAELLRAMVSAAFYLGNEQKVNEYFAKLQRLDPLLAHQLLYAMESQAGMKHTPKQTLLYLAKELWYGWLQGDTHDA
jgi:tetratricopeptide (TPR) repeat protein